MDYCDIADCQKTRIEEKSSEGLTDDIQTEEQLKEVKQKKNDNNNLHRDNKSEVATKICRNRFFHFGNSCRNNLPPKYKSKYFRN